MEINDYLNRISAICGHNEPSELLRMAFLISLRVEDLSSLNDESLRRLYNEVTYELQAATDQHAAVSEELDSLADSQPCEFSPNHVWTLVRAIKVQSRCLNMYLGQTAARS
jgi:hypothetical protein